MTWLVDDGPTCGSSPVGLPVADRAFRPAVAVLSEAGSPLIRRASRTHPLPTGEGGVGALASFAPNRSSGTEMTLRIVFMGTPAFAAPTLAEIVGQGHEVAAVYTRAPAAAGRGMALKPSPVQALAERFGLPVLTPTTLRGDDAAAAFRAHGADAAVVVAYGMILPRPILDAPALGCLNLHASLLPRWRGAAPIQRAVMAGDSETGVAVMRMEEGLDTGPVAMVERVAIGPDMTAGDVHDRLMPLGADLMARALAALSRGALQFTSQPDEGVTYAKKITNEEARIDWRAARLRTCTTTCAGCRRFRARFLRPTWAKARSA